MTGTTFTPYKSSSNFRCEIFRTRHSRDPYNSPSCQQQSRGSNANYCPKLKKQQKHHTLPGRKTYGERTGGWLIIHGSRQTRRSPNAWKSVTHKEAPFFSSACTHPSVRVCEWQKMDRNSLTMTLTHTQSLILLVCGMWIAPTPGPNCREGPAWTPSLHIYACFCLFMTLIWCRRGYAYDNVRFRSVHQSDPPCPQPSQNRQIEIQFDAWLHTLIKN